MKKIRFLSLIFSVWFLIFGVFNFAWAADYKCGGIFQPPCSLVPCGGTGQSPCTLCHFFAVFSNIIHFITFDLTPAVAMLMFLIGGIILLTAGGNEQRLAKGKQLVTNTVVGLLIIYLGWLLINSLLTTIAPNFGGLTGQPWYQGVQCK